MEGLSLAEHPVLPATKEMAPPGRARPAKAFKEVKLFQASAFALPLRDAVVETVFCVRFLHHIGSNSERVALLREMARVSSRSVCLSLWVDGNYKSLQRRRIEATPPTSGYQNRFLLSRRQVEKEFHAAGLEPLVRLHLLRFYSMWTTYVLRKR